MKIHDGVGIEVEETIREKLEETDKSIAEIKIECVGCGESQRISSNETGAPTYIGLWAKGHTKRNIAEHGVDFDITLEESEQVGNVDINIEINSE